MTNPNPEAPEAGTPVPFPLVLGLDTFGDLIYDQDGRPLSHAETIRSLVEQGVLALHRTEAGAWADTDVALLEAVAREAGLTVMLDGKGGDRADARQLHVKISPLVSRRHKSFTLRS